MVAVVACLVPIAIGSRYVSADESLPRGDLTGWRQLVAEDFTTQVPLGSYRTSEYASSFHPYDGFADTFGHGRYVPDRVLSVDDGMLNWYLHSEEGVGQVAAVVVASPQSGWGQTYGRYSVRFKSDVVPGYKMAFLLWPDSDNWGEGEIDFPETHSLDAGGLISANLYRKGDISKRKPGSSTGFSTELPGSGTGWHVGTIEWQPEGVTFILDGVVLGTKRTGVPDTSMHWVLQVETSADGPSGDQAVDGHVQVDWVTLYGKN